MKAITDTIQGKGESIVVSDWHLKPNESLPENGASIIKEAIRLKKLLVFNGDIFDLLEYGVKAYDNSPALNSFLEVIDEADYGNVYFIVGNHEAREDWTRQLFKANSRVMIGDKWETEIGGRKWLFIHGDNYGLDWKILRRPSQMLAEFFSLISRKMWLKICQLRWPSYFLQKGQVDKYNGSIGGLWGQALRDIGVTNIVIGHTHCACCVDLADIAQLADCGSLKDGTAITIDANGKARLFRASDKKMMV